MCKRIFVTMMMLVVFAIMRAEAQQLNYQAIARNANGVALTFRDVGIRLSIRDGSPNGFIVYSESRNIRTNQFGLFTVIIGSPGASNVLGSMASINWISGNKYLQVEIDPEGGTNYFQAGTSQLQAVPYALFANAAYPVGPAGGDLLGSTYPNPIIAPLAVTTGKIANQAITTPKIADLNVTTPKLADQAVTNAKIQDNTIANIKLVNSRVTLNGLILNLGDAQDFAIGTNGIDVNIVSAENTHTFNFPDASIANRGLITPNAQTIGGNKTFNNNITAASFIRAGGIAAQFLKADGSVDNNIYLTENQPIIVTATGDAIGVSTSSRTAPVLPLTLATVNSSVGTYGTNIVIPSITVNNKGLVTNVIANAIPTATATTSGLLTVGDWNIFNNKQNAIPLGSTAQYFRGDLTLSNFTTDVRNQLSAGTNITYNNGNIGLTNNSVTLNTLPLTLGGSQTFATGTTGVDFNISSVGSVHSFNIPTASVFARGLLSSIDYTNFNAAYTNRISSLTTTGTSGAATLSANVLNIPNYSYTLPAATATTLGGIIPGANITNTSGTISIAGNNVIDALGTQTANRFFVAPNGSNGLPSFRVLTTADIPDNTVTNIKLANSIINLGSTNIPLGTTANTLSGLTSITSSAFVGPLTGNASTASAWANARTISTTGDLTYTSNPFDGSANTTGVATLANSGVTAGDYGSANEIPRITVDAKGRLTSVSTNLISGVSNLGSSLNAGNIIIGNAANIAAQFPVTGDVTLSNTGVTTIGALKVTDAMLFGSITDGKLATISTGGKVANSATTATNLNNINTIVSRDGSGNFSAGTITANLTGNVTGNVTGTAANVTGIVLGANGGTGVANTGRTMTLGGNVVTAGDLTTVGAFATTLTSTAPTNVTLPTTGTLATLAGTEILTNKTIITPIINFSNNTTVSAGTDAQGQGAITNDMNIISSTATSPSGITLPNGTAGRRIIIVNRGLNAIKVYPPINGFIDGLPQNAAYSSIPTGTSLEFYASSVNQWYSSNNATAGSSSSQWNLIGNAGINESTNFIGTTDNNILKFRVNDKFSGQIHYDDLVGNTSFGLETNSSNTTGSFNTAFGTYALKANTTSGFQNTALGAFALAANNTGDDNTGLGQGSLSLNTSGGNNTGVGQGTLNKNLTGSSNTAIGHAALNLNSTTSNNTAVGKSALFANEGSNNTGIGHFALIANTSGSSNTAVGQNSLSANTTTSNNTAVGWEALRSTTNNGNVGVGYRADVGAGVSEAISIGISSNVTGDNSIAIGRNSSATNINSVVIGNTATTNQQNTISIGLTASTTNASAIAMGNNASASGENSIAIGKSSVASNQGSVAIGDAATNNTINSILLGGTSNTLVNATGALTATGRITGTGARFAYDPITADITLGDNHYYLKVTSSTAIITLPDATTRAGQRYVIANRTSPSTDIRTNILTTSAQTITGFGWGAFSFDANFSLIVFSDGLNWILESPFR